MRTRVAPTPLSPTLPPSLLPSTVPGASRTPLGHVHNLSILGDCGMTDPGPEEASLDLLRYSCGGRWGRTPCNGQACPWRATCASWRRDPSDRVHAPLRRSIRYLRWHASDVLQLQRLQARPFGPGSIMLAAVALEREVLFPSKELFRFPFDLPLINAPAKAATLGFTTEASACASVCDLHLRSSQRTVVVFRTLVSTLCV